MGTFNEQWTVQPHGELTTVAEGILTVEGTIKTPFGLFPRRMTVISLGSGGTAVWSPIPLDAKGMARLEALGPVKFLIVPNAGHRLDIKPWAERYPAATVIAPPSASEAVAEAVPVGATHDAIQDLSIDFQLMPGTKSDEFALIVRRPDGTTLILNDILASVRHPRGIMAWLIATTRGFGVKRPRVSHPVRRMFVTDGAQVAAQFRAWAQIPDLRRIIVSHVDVIDQDPRGALETAAADFD